MPFRDITGHEQLRALIASAALRGTLPPSLIFAGPAGVGKHMAAVALAQLVNCVDPDLRTRGSSDPETADACGECAQCRRIARRVHSDVLFLEPGDTGSIKIEQVREAVESASYRPFEGRRRVVIIDDAEQLGVPAQDALLKTLEEPPNATAFVLVTAAAETLLPTIRSRCQRLRFGRLSPAQVADVLIRRHEYAPADAHAAAALADGSVARALEGATEDFQDLRTGALSLLQTVADEPGPARRIQGGLGLAGARSGDREVLAQSLRVLASMLRDLGILNAEGEADALANVDLRSDLQRLLRGYDQARVLRGFAAVDRALNALDRNASPKIVADWLSFQV